MAKADDIRIEIQGDPEPFLRALRAATREAALFEMSMRRVREAAATTSEQISELAKQLEEQADRLEDE